MDRQKVPCIYAPVMLKSWAKYSRWILKFCPLVRIFLERGNQYIALDIAEEKDKVSDRRREIYWDDVTRLSHDQALRYGQTWDWSHQWILFSGSSLRSSRLWKPKMINLSLKLLQSYPKSFNI